MMEKKMSLQTETLDCELLKGKSRVVGDIIKKVPQAKRKKTKDPVTPERPKKKDRDKKSYRVWD